MREQAELNSQHVQPMESPINASDNELNEKFKSEAKLKTPPSSPNPVKNAIPEDIGKET